VEKVFLQEHFYVEDVRTKMQGIASKRLMNKWLAGIAKSSVTTRFRLPGPSPCGSTLPFVSL
jgi:hypothetical protein